MSRLLDLVEDSDAIFLLIDTRESRCIPTVMVRSLGEILINTNLGLDGWLVMQHGVSEQTSYCLGCYLCIPQELIHNRTVNQQCTVVRMGLNPVAASM